jgi:hypothetical protein
MVRHRERHRERHTEYCLTMPPQAFGRHVVLEKVKNRVEVPLWLDILIVRVIGVVHVLLLAGGMAVCAMGVALSAGVAPSWTAATVAGMGAAVMASSSTALYALSVKRPDLLSVAMYGLVGLVAWVACVATVLYILVAQVDSPVAGYIICHWNETEAVVAAQTLTAEALGDDYLSADGTDLTCSPEELATPAPYINCSVRSADSASPRRASRA